MSWPGRLNYSGQFTHISGHRSAVGWVQDSEISPVKDQRSTTVLRNQSTFKLACLTYVSLTVCQPAYLCMLIHHNAPTRTPQLTNIPLPPDQDHISDVAKWR